MHATRPAPLTPLVDAGARRRAGERAIAAAAAAPVRVVPAAFIAALRCEDVHSLPERHLGGLRPAL